MSITTLKALSEDLAELLTAENFRIIESRLRAYGSREIRYAASTVLCRFVGALVYKTLVEQPAINQTKPDHEAYVLKNTAELKAQLQDAVALGFQHAMSAFSGQTIEYYCQIKVVPEPNNSTIN